MTQNPHYAMAPYPSYPPAGPPPPPVMPPPPPVMPPHAYPAAAPHAYLAAAPQPYPGTAVQAHPEVAPQAHPAMTAQAPSAAKAPQPPPATAPPSAQRMSSDVEIFHGKIHPPCLWCCPTPDSCAVEWEVTNRRVDYKRPLCCCCGTEASTAQVRHIKDVDYWSCCCCGKVTVHMADPKETLHIEGFGDRRALKAIYKGLKKAVADLKVHLLGSG